MPKIKTGTSTFGKASDAPLKLLADHGCEVELNPYGRTMTKKEAIDFLKDADGLLAGLEPLDREVLESCKGKLKAIARVGVGMDNVDQAAAKELGIPVSNTPDEPAAAVAEMTLGAMLALGRRIPSMNDDLHAGKWNKKVAFSLKGATVLVVGYGRIGQAVAKMFEFMGSKVLVYDPAHPEVSLKSLEDGLKQANIVTIHASGKNRIIEKRHLDLLPDGSYLLDAARGGMVDEEAILEALESGKLAGCWLDVFQNEPYSGPLASQPNALLTPHVSSYTSVCREEMEMSAARNLLRDLGLLEEKAD